MIHTGYNKIMNHPLKRAELDLMSELWTAPDHTSTRMYSRGEVDVLARLALDGQVVHDPETDAWSLTDEGLMTCALEFRDSDGYEDFYGPEDGYDDFYS